MAIQPVLQTSSHQNGFIKQLAFGAQLIGNLQVAIGAQPITDKNLAINVQAITNRKLFIWAQLIIDRNLVLETGKFTIGLSQLETGYL